MVLISTVRQDERAKRCSTFFKIFEFGFGIERVAGRVLVVVTSGIFFQGGCSVRIRLRRKRGLPTLLGEPSKYDVVESLGLRRFRLDFIEWKLGVGGLLSVANIWMYLHHRHFCSLGKTVMEAQAVSTQGHDGSEREGTWDWDR